MIIDEFSMCSKKHKKKGKPRRKGKFKDRLKDRSREDVPVEHNLPLTGLQLTGWGVVMLQQRPWT